MLVTLCVIKSIDSGNKAFSSDAESVPNIVLIMADDLGWGDVGFNGSTKSKTPQLDQMAANSLKFQRFYAAAPVCSPTRGSMLTGRHPHRYGIPYANTGHMKQEEFTLAEALRSKGYRTGHFGKWHLGTLTTKLHDANRARPGDDRHYATPAMHGFDQYFSTESKVPTYDPLWVPQKFGANQSRHYGWIPVENQAEAKFYGTHYWVGKEKSVEHELRGDDSQLIMDRALPFIAETVDEELPFFTVIWFHTPHLPVVAGKEHRQRFKHLPLKEQLYYGSIAAMDDQIGRLRAELRRLEVAKNTMVWFTSDNGPEVNTPGSAGPFRDRKRSLYEGGVRVPGLVEWPAVIGQARETPVPAVTSDCLPTILAAVGIEAHEEQVNPLDGIDLLPLFEGELESRPHPIGFQSKNVRTWNDNQYKLFSRTGKRSKLELYDLLADPGEQHDIADEHPQLTARMLKELQTWQESCQQSAAGKDYAPENTATK